MVRGWLREEALECCHEVRWVAALGALEAARRREDHAGVMFTGTSPGPNDTVEVLGILCHHCSTIASRGSYQVIVCQHGEPWILSCGEHVMTGLAKAFSCSGGVVDVEQQLHPASNFWRRRQSASDSSAAATLLAISSSISSGKAA